MKIAYIGLGAMGAPMAAHLVSAGHAVTGFNRTASKAQAWLERSSPLGDARIAATPAEAAQGAEVIITSVGNDVDLAQILLGARGAISAAAKGALLIDHTTISARLARQLSVECSDRELAFVDAPVSGGQPGAEKGILSIMCGGNDRAFARARPVMEAYAARIVHIGSAGAGQSAKMVNQVCAAGLIAGLAEAVRFAQGAGLDPDKVFEAISGGAAQSWQMDNRWGTMVADQFDFGFAVDWMRKDLGYALEEARRLGVTLPITALVDQFYGEVQQMGGGRQDTSAIVRRFPRGGNK